MITQGRTSTFRLAIPDHRVGWDKRSASTKPSPDPSYRPAAGSRRIRCAYPPYVSGWGCRCDGPGYLRLPRHALTIETLGWAIPGYRVGWDKRSASTKLSPDAGAADAPASSRRMRCDYPPCVSGRERRMQGPRLHCEVARFFRHWGVSVAPQAALQPRRNAQRRETAWASAAREVCDVSVRRRGGAGVPRSG